MTTTQPTDPATAPIMGDFIFGGIESDQGRLLADQRNQWRGIRHLHTLDPLDPLPDQPVTVTVFVGPDVNVDQVTVYVTTDHSAPSGQRGVAANGFAVALQRSEVRWQPLIWGFVEIWQGQIPAQPAATPVQYRIEGWQTVDQAVSIWSREPNLDRTLERPTLYGYSVDRFATPQWAHEAVVYHIFVDRFTGIENRWLTPQEMNSFTGGTLRGIIDKLEYIVTLGVTTIWLSPIFRTPTYHGYDTTDYYTVDPRFGSNADLHELVTAAHAHGLRVLLDFVANHTSTEFAPFVGAQANSNSAYRDWFSFDPAYKHGYRAFFDVKSMPQIDTDNPEARRFLIDAACYWLTEYGIDGYRLDYAAGPSHAFWSDFRAACRRAKPDCWLFGEVTLAGDALRTYIGRLDGCLDFAFARRVRQLCADAQPEITIGQFANAVERSRHFFGTDFALPSFIDNHDMNRFLWVAGNDKRRLRLAAGLMFALGGPPVIYYGTEVGLSQPSSKGSWREESRHPMLWGEAQDSDLLDYFKQLIALRRQHGALTAGSLRTHYLDNERGIWLVERMDGADRVLVAINVGEGAQMVVVPPDFTVALLGSATCGIIPLPGLSLAFFALAADGDL
ncbi:MAG: glycoside hydrolase family 13 protein [Chloroflexota bacterium]|nr:glycoside hydrolase family 13 protein [Chloroflexota bacterium]